MDTFFFANAGAEAVEGAVKLAKHYTGRTNIIVFQGGFHGRTHLTMAMTTGKNVYRFDYQPLPSGIFVAPFPSAYRYQMTAEAASQWALRELDLILHTQTDPEETAAFVIEPVMGGRGLYPRSRPFPPRLAASVRPARDIVGRRRNPKRLWTALAAISPVSTAM